MVVVENLVRSECQDTKKFIYSYRIVKGTILLSSEFDTIEVQSYGIEIERQDMEEDMITNIERDCVKNITPHRHKVHNLLKLLYDNEVSPYHLVDVLCEYVDEYIGDFDEALKNIATN